MPQDSSNEHLDFVAAVLDDIFRIPGTNIRFGLDAIIGWVPGIGDAIAGTASFLIVFASWRRGARTITLVRIMANVFLETTIGAVPLVGDISTFSGKRTGGTIGCFSESKINLVITPDAIGRSW
jgi:hypothetical protein